MSKGTFVKALSRNSGEVLNHRAASIGESAKIAYKRRVEDLEFALNDMKRQQEAMLDMSPDNTQSLILAKNFSAPKFAEEDANLALKIHNTEVKLKVEKARYEELFGTE